MKNKELIKFALNNGIKQSNGDVRNLTIYDLHLLTEKDFRLIRPMINRNRSTFTRTQYDKLNKILPDIRQFEVKNINDKMHYSFLFENRTKVYTTKPDYAANDKQEVVYVEDAFEAVKKILIKNNSKVDESMYTSILKHYMMYGFEETEEELSNLVTEYAEAPKSKRL